MNSARVGGLKWSVGKANVCSAVLANRGVITNSNSDFSVWNALLRNKAPSTGSSPNKGNARIASVTLLLIKPPMAKLSPSLSCTVVEARRVVMEGKTLT